MPAHRESATSLDGPVRPGALTALLADLARAPEAAGWDLPVSPGETIGRFEIVRELGRGGFGVVYEARDVELGRSVAFKAVRSGSSDAVREQRALAEAEAAARLAHPNIVHLYDVGRCERGPFLIMELLRGETLDERLARGPLPLREAVPRRGGDRPRRRARARAGGGAPGSQAGERLPVRGRAGEGARLRARARVRKGRRRGRDAGLHGAGASRGGGRGRAFGHVRARGDRARTRHRETAVRRSRGRTPRGGEGAGAARRACRAWKARHADAGAGARGATGERSGGAGAAGRDPEIARADASSGRPGRSRRWPCSSPAASHCARVRSRPGGSSSRWPTPTTRRRSRPRRDRVAAR